jgi:predicted AAA+ superfamily ATPase
MQEIPSHQNEILFKAYAKFIEAFRLYLVSMLQREFKELWLEQFIVAQNDTQQVYLRDAQRQGKEGGMMIDYQYLRNLLIRYREAFRVDFERETNSLQTRIDDIVAVRNKLSHYQLVSKDEYEAVFIAMRRIATTLRMTELTDYLNVLQEEGNTKPKASEATLLQAWFQNVLPHKDIEQGRLDESVFAANLAEVATGKGREIYSNSELFFQKTYPTNGLKLIAQRVIKGLNGGQDSENRVISLQTGFGGGKTHTLISLYHIAKSGKDLSSSIYARELLLGTMPTFERANTAVFTNTTNDPTQGRTVDGIIIRTIWGELAYQLGGREAYELIRANDEGRTAPKGLFKSVLQKCVPALILIDELADYCVSASAIKVGGSTLNDQTISFMQELTEAVASTDQCVMIATLPASAQEVAASPESAQILATLENRIARIGAALKPVEDEEIFEVVRRRLFEDLGSHSEMDKVVKEYQKIYTSLGQELPSYATKSEYGARMRKAYPFHPELIDMFRLRWASNHAFQRTRGVLRLLAGIVSDLWNRRQSLTGSQYLIHTSDVVFQNVDALTAQITMLNGAGWNTVIAADIAGSSANATRVDEKSPDLGKYQLTQGIAATLLLGTFGSRGQNKGVSIAELKLCMVKPKSFSHNDINGAIDKFEAVAHYLYYNSSSSSSQSEGQKKYWFDTTPNINILVNEAKRDIQDNVIETELLRRLKELTKNNFPFDVIIDPSTDIIERDKLTLILLNPNYTALASAADMPENTRNFIQRIATKKGNSERIYRNTILFLVCSEMGSNKLKEETRSYLACQTVSREYASQLSKEQRADISQRIEDANKSIESNLASAYSLAIKHNLRNGCQVLAVKDFKQNLAAQISSYVVEALKAEEWLLESVGQGLLKNNNLLPNENNTAIRAKDVYEAFLRFDDKPIILNKDAVQKSLLRYALNGSFAVASGDGKAFDRFYYKENVQMFDVADSTYWLVDKSLIPPPPAPIIEVQDNNPISTDSSNINTAINIRENVRHGTNSDAQPIKQDLQGQIQKINALLVSGQISATRYADLFTSFVAPILMSKGQVDITVSFKIHASQQHNLNTNSELNARFKEAARQYGLDFEELG